MKWSIKIGRIAGINIYLHATFLILLVWLIVNQVMAGHRGPAMLGIIAFVALIFVIIVFHELGHALAARRYGIETRDITLLPIGGVARLERMPEDPLQELVVAIAGPLVNFVIAGGIFIGIALRAGPAEIFNAALSGGDFMAELFWINVWLAVFNLLPAFPMDGGRVLRAILALKMSRVRATEIAVAIGHVMALIFAAAGLFVLGAPLLAFVALFIWLGADAELNQIRATMFMRGVPVRAVMATDFRAIPATMTLGDLTKTIVPGFQTDFPVFEGERLVGFIGIEDMVRGLSESGPETTVGSVAQKVYDVATPDESLEEASAASRSGRGAVLAVIDHGKLLGIVTPANIGEHLMLRSAIDRGPSKPHRSDAEPLPRG